MFSAAVSDGEPIAAASSHAVTASLHAVAASSHAVAASSHIRLQVATAVAGDGEALPTEASMVWLLDIERLRDNERYNQRDAELRDIERDSHRDAELMETERLRASQTAKGAGAGSAAFGASAGPAAVGAGSGSAASGAGSTPLQLVLEALDDALTSDAVRVLSY